MKAFKIANKTTSVPISVMNLTVTLTTTESLISYKKSYNFQKKQLNLQKMVKKQF